MLLARQSNKDEPNRPSSKLIKVVNVSDLPSLEKSPKIERCEYLASYNWLDHPKSPTILVLGIDSLQGGNWQGRKLIV